MSKYYPSLQWMLGITNQNRTMTTKDKTSYNNYVPYYWFWMQIEHKEWNNCFTTEKILILKK
jgi:hypothetical protein